MKRVADGLLQRGDLGVGGRDPRPGDDTLTVTLPNPVYQNLTAQLREVKTEHEIRQKEKAWIESQIQQYNQRIQSAPRHEREILSVVRQHGELSKQYDDLKNKLSQARLAESLESRQKGSQFIIVDPANYPLLPTKPNRFALTLMGLGMSLAPSFLLAIAVDFLTQKIWSQSEIEKHFGLPVLAEIPEIVDEDDIAKLSKKRLAYAAVFLAATFLYAWGLYSVYLKRSIVIRSLDPIIERIIR